MNRPSAIVLDRFELTYPGSLRIAPLTWALGPGDRLGLAGESGCGKTTLLEYLAGLARPGAQTSGQCHVEGPIGYVPQDPLNNLSPFLRSVEQVAHVAGSLDKGREWLTRVGLGDARKWNARPQQLSGGERQRVLLAQALAASPRVILADEPAAHLDADTQEMVLDLLDRLVAESGASLLVASHQEAVFARLGCRVHRMTPAPADLPPGPTALSSPDLVVQAQDLQKLYSHRGFFLNRQHPRIALNRVSLQIHRGETVAVTGPSGCGKSTLARCLAGFERCDSGSIGFAAGRSAQLVQQDPSSSLNPRFTIGGALREASPDCGPELLGEMNLPNDWMHRPVAALSEGQRARVAIARAMEAAGGGLLILDESLSSLDAGTVGFIAAAIRERQARTGLACLLITHDADLTGSLAHRELRMSEGRLVA